MIRARTPRVSIEEIPKGTTKTSQFSVGILRRTLEVILRTSNKRNLRKIVASNHRNKYEEKPGKNTEKKCDKNSIRTININSSGNPKMNSEYNLGRNLGRKARTSPEKLRDISWEKHRKESSKIRTG